MVKRVNISFPEKTLKELRELVPPRGRSRLVNEAVEERLKLLRRKKALKKINNYIKVTPESERPFAFLKTRKDIDRWLKDIRRGWDVREKKLIRETQEVK